MSTYQPPGGPPSGPPGYVPPQDPWAVPEHGGLASVPTDPIPHSYEQQQYPTGSDVWGAATVQHGGQSGLLVAEPTRNRAGLLAVIFMVVLVLGGGGGYATYYFVRKHGEATAITQTDRDKAQVGQCMVNRGTDPDHPVMELAACTEANSYKIVKVARGTSVPRDTNGEVEPKSASATVCAGLKYDNFYVYWDSNAPAQNVVICLAQNQSTVTPTTAR
jgi:hypothetical protein